MSVARVIWQDVGRVTEPGRYMFKFGWVTITADDLAIWTAYPDATFALYEVLGPEQLNNEYRLGSVQLPLGQSQPLSTGPVAITGQFDYSQRLVGKPSEHASTPGTSPPPSSPE
jgi:hypothetical protein